MSIIKQIMPFLLTLLSSFLIAYLTSHLCFWLYGKIREKLNIDDSQKITPEDIKKWQMLLISLPAYMLPSLVYTQLTQHRTQIAWLIGSVGLTIVLSLAIGFTFIKNSQLEESF